MNQRHRSFSVSLLLLSANTNGFSQSSSNPFTFRHLETSSRTPLRMAAPQRLSDNADGPLYINDKCINCAACSMFAPSVFGRSEERAAHIVHHQPSNEQELDEARAALRACPVASIRLENQAFRSHRKMEPLTSEEERIVDAISDASQESFPIKVSPNIPGVYFVGHHNSKSFGAAPYLLETNNHGWILMDSPKYSKKAVETIEKLTGPVGPTYMVLSHVDDTADHGKWKEHYPNMNRVFHSGDLGRHNWIGDTTLEDVEFLHTLKSTDESLQAMTLEGEAVDEDDYQNHELLIVHTPGHSPGSITLWKLPSGHGNEDGVLFSGDTYSYTTRDGGHMSSFPQYGDNHLQQAKTLKGLLKLDWHMVAPGHGHVRDYSIITNDEKKNATLKDFQEQDMHPAFAELTTTARW
jgi:glyoxylase-like metal-dependent hydrolase (beta-lactamase superfamily II)/ferredoxin